MTTRRPALLDERSDRPLRRVIGDLLMRCDTADIAIARIRLAALDLTREEVRGPSRARVLLGHLDAATLLDAPATAASRPSTEPPSLDALREWLESGRLEVRSAGIGAWAPDFSIYTDRTGEGAALVGAHYFGAPHLTVGPSFTVLSHEPDDRVLLAGRFEELWRRGHDVAPAIMHVIERAVARSGGAGDGVA